MLCRSVSTASRIGTLVISIAISAIVARVTPAAVMNATSAGIERIATPSFATLPSAKVSLFSSEAISSKLVLLRRFLSKDYTCQRLNITPISEIYLRLANSWEAMLILHINKRLYNITHSNSHLKVLGKSDCVMISQAVHTKTSCLPLVVMPSLFLHFFAELTTKCNWAVQQRYFKYQFILWLQQLHRSTVRNYKAEESELPHPMPSLILPTGKIMPHRFLQRMYFRFPILSYI